MAIPQLTDEQVNSMSVREKDRWWLDHVYLGDTPQMTARVILSGCLIGGLVAVMNLYVGARIGASMGTSIIAVVLGYLVFGALRRAGLTRDLRIGEGVMLQSIACSAGYMCSPLTASMAAYMAVTGIVVPWWQMICWLLGLSAMGVLFAIPFKRRFINNEQMPFPEGRACGVVLDTLLTRTETPSTDHRDPRKSVEQVALPARVLVWFGCGAVLVKLLQTPVLLQKLRVGFLAIPEVLDDWYYRLAAARGLWMPAIGSVPLRELTIRPSFDIAMIALGGFMGMRTCLSLIVGAIINYCILAPWMVRRGDIVTRMSPDGALLVGFRAITTWSLWCGAAIMTCASLWSFVAISRATIREVSRRLNTRGKQLADPLESVELPITLFLVGAPLVSGWVVWMVHAFFGVAIWLGIVAVPLVLATTLIAVNATALTSMTPHGALGKVTQLAFGVLAPNNISTNIAAAGISSEVALQASNFIQNVKPGYMIGAKPRLQAVGHLLGAVSGSCVGVAVFYLLFLKSDPTRLASEQYPFPAAVVWKAVAEMLSGRFGGLPSSALYAAIIGAVVGVVMEAVRLASKGRFPLSPVSLGLAFVIPFDVSLAMFAGALLFWIAAKWRPRPDQWLNRVVVQNQDAVCAGVVAGAAIVSVTIIALFGG